MVYEGLKMKIIIEIENKYDFDPQEIIDWINEKFYLRSFGDNRFWAKLIGVEEEDDETD